MRSQPVWPTVTRLTPFYNMDLKVDPFYILAENFDHLKRTLTEEREYEARLRKYVRSLQASLALCSSQSCHEILICRITENNIEILKLDHEKEVETLKEEAKRLKEELISLQRQNEDGEQLNSELQEQISQLTKQVKTIPDLHRDVANLQTRLGSMDRRMKESSEQARGAQVCPAHKQAELKTSHIPVFAAVKISDFTRQLLHGAVEEEVLLG